MKPADWPRYMVAKRLASGEVAYYWNARKKDIDGGFKLGREALGQNYGTAIERAKMLNTHLDAWRQAPAQRQLSPDYLRVGSVDWWIERYYRSDAFLKLSERTKPAYRYQLGLLVDLPTKTGGRLGELMVRSITPAAVDKIYEHLRGGRDGTKYRRANHTVDIAKKAWRVVQRTHPREFPGTNPFVGLTRIRTVTPIKHASREEAYALSMALVAYGHPHLAAVPLICFEWLQRPENVLSGHLRWEDYRPPERPNHVRIFHHKTGEEVWHPLEDDGDRLYPELENYLAQLDRLRGPIIVSPGKRSAPAPYSMSYAKNTVAKARRVAGLPEHVTLTACRHGGMTELGDAEVTEQGVMSLSGHRTPEAARGYMKRTETQRLAAAKKRRAWISRA